MLTINGKELRNLEEQVLANKENFENLVASGNVLDEFGIKVVGEVPNVEDLPAEDSEQFEALEYGDAYAVGIEPPYELYIKTRANDTHENDYWLDIGEFPKAGPAGPQGPQGIRGLQGVRGSIWTSSGSAPSVSQGQNLNDQHLNTLTGDVYQRENNQWVSTGSIKGPQGVQGPQGPIGPAGPQGIQGIQGPQGEPGEAFTIIGTLTSTAQLPDPTSIPRNDAYLVGVTQPYDLYVIVGEDELTWLNAGQVSGVKGDQGDTGPQGPQGPQGTAGQQGERGVSTLSLNQLQYGFLKQANWYKVNDTIIATEDFSDEDIEQSFTKGKVYQVTQVSPLQIADDNMSIIGPAGEGIPSGGTAGQVLTKVDATDYNVQWANAGGGKRYLHQFVFRKSSSTSPEFAYFSIENNSTTLMGKSGISSWLYNKGCVSESTSYRKDISVVIGSNWFSSLNLPIDACIYSDNGTNIILRYHPTQITMDIDNQPNKFKIEYTTGSTLNKFLNETAYTLAETVIEL